MPLFLCYHSFMTALIIVLILLLFIIWNMFLPFYKDRNKEKLVSDESRCFSPRCRSIVLREDGRDRAVLMIHGFPTTPYMYDYSSKRLFEAGYDVYAPLIPTFGADISEFEQTNFTQWFDFIRDCYTDLRKRYPFLAVIGVSMGGAMTLKLGEEFSSTELAPDALVSISAPVAYNNIRYGIYTSLPAYFARTIGLFRPSIGARQVDGLPEKDDGNENWVGYEGLFVKQGMSLIKAFDRIRKDLPKIAVPMFVMHDRGDKTVPFKNLSIIEKFCSEHIEVKREVEMTEGHHSHHSLLMYYSVQKGYTDEIIEFLGGIYERKAGRSHKLG